MTLEQVIKMLEDYYTRVRDENAKTNYADDSESGEVSQAFDDGWNAGMREAIRTLKDSQNAITTILGGK